MIHAQLAVLRAACGYTVDEFAYALGTPAKVVRYYESPQRKRRLDTVVRVVRALGCALDDLRTEQEIYTPPTAEVDRSFSTRLRWLVRRDGLNLRQLALLLGWDTTTVWSWANGDAWPSWENFLTLCNHFQVPPSWLFPMVRK